MRIDSACFSKPGPRGRNEDAVLEPVVSGAFLVAAVADGMGGHVGGAVASRTVIDALGAMAGANDGFDMAAAFAYARRRLEDVADEQPRLLDMGTTLSVARIGGGAVEIGHVGDTRIDLVRDGAVIAGTRDQTEVQRLVDQGVLSESQALTYPRRSVLLSALLPGRSYDLHCARFEIAAGDRLLFMSDGLYECIGREELAKHARAAATAHDLCATVERIVAARTPRDDHSLLCVGIGS